MTNRLDQPSPLAGPQFVRWPDATQVQELQRQLLTSNLDFGQLAEQIERYPGLSGHFMRKVNSINKGYGRRIVSVRHALILLGSNGILRELASVTLTQTVDAS